ncbi:MAG: hypothetical protein SFV17_06130 [Candidatus Obscuribacter sp.]|nr:hypothetical protein [Candidatus Obscuribacter sp.]
MNKNQFFARICIIPALFLAASLSGAITSSWWAAPLIGFGVALVFTFVSERLLRQKLMGKIGGGVLSWYTVHLIGETLTIAALVWLCSILFGMGKVPGWTYTILALATWVYLCKEMIFKLPGLFAMWIVTRR